MRAREAYTAHYGALVCVCVCVRGTKPVAACERKIKGRAAYIRDFITFALVIAKKSRRECVCCWLFWACCRGVARLSSLQDVAWKWIINYMSVDFLGALVGSF